MRGKLPLSLFWRKSMKYKGVIFDFNGTLYYDTPFHNIAWQRMVRKITGRDLDAELKQKMHGKNNKEILYCIKADMSKEENCRYSVEKEVLYRSICLEHPDSLHLIAGAENLFYQLKKNNIPFTIASASVEDNINFFIKTFSLDRWFDVSKIVYDDGRFDDKVAMFTYACELLHILPSEAVVFEDSDTGIQNAKSVGIGCIVGIGPKENHSHLKQLGVNFCIEDYTQFDDLSFLK